MRAVAQFIYYSLAGVVPKPGVFASGARDLACSADTFSKILRSA